MGRYDVVVFQRKVPLRENVNTENINNISSLSSIGNRAWNKERNVDKVAIRPNIGILICVA